MKYKVYKFTGITLSDGTTKSITLDDVIRKHDKFFSSPLATTIELFDGNEEGNPFCLSAYDFDMNMMSKIVERGYVIVPFSRTFYICDLLKYYDLGLFVIFMKIKDYKQFKEDYAESIVLSVQDNRTKELF